MAYIFFSNYNVYKTILTDWLNTLLIVDCWPCLSATLQDGHLFNMPPKLFIHLLVKHAYMHKVQSSSQNHSGC